MRAVILLTLASMKAMKLPMASLGTVQLAMDLTPSAQNLAKMEF